MCPKPGSSKARLAARTGDGGVRRGDSGAGSVAGATPALLRSSLQNRHIVALALIVSAQRGHSMHSPGREECLAQGRGPRRPRRLTVATTTFAAANTITSMVGGV